MLNMKVNFDFNEQKKVDLVTMILPESSTALRVKYDTSGHFVFDPKPSPRIGRKLAMLVGVLNNAELGNDS